MTDTKSADHMDRRQSAPRIREGPSRNRSGVSPPAATGAPLPPVLPAACCAIAFLRCRPASTAELVDLVRATHYDHATGRLDAGQHEAVLRYVHAMHEHLERTVRSRRRRWQPP